MNRIYRLVFNRSLQVWQAVSELVRSAGKGGGRVRKPVVAVALSLAAGTVTAQTVTIDNGDEVTVPSADYPSPWNPGTTLRVGYSGVGKLTIEQGAEVSVTEGHVGRNVAGTGTVTVKGAGSHWSATYVYVGFEGTGTVNIEDGAVVSSNNGYLGYNPTGNGTVKVSGADSLWQITGTFNVARSGGGSLLVEDGGKVTSGTSAIGYSSGTADGAVTVTGMNSRWETGALTVGQGGRGTLNIEEKGVVTSSTGNVGGTPDGDGTVTVKGAGSRWEMTGDLNIGQNGTGKLTIEDGGKVLNQKGYISRQGSATGEVVVKGAGSLWTNSANLDVGTALSGSLRIEAGGKVTNTFGKIAIDQAAEGTVTVTGTDSHWENANSLVVAQSGTATLNIEDGGKVSSATAIVGYFAGSQFRSTGVVKVTGANSHWEMTSNFDIGYLGTGTLTIENGGKVTNNSSYIGRDVQVQDGSPGSGTVTVTGAGSRWENAGLLNVGNKGIGTLTIEDGGKVNSQSGYVGTASGGTGTVTVTGTDSLWEISNFVHVGDEGNGTLNIEAGGKVTGNTGSIGDDATGTGKVTVTGADSRWESTGSLTVGSYGNGTLIIEKGGVARSGGGTVARYAGSEGTVTVKGEGSLWENVGVFNVGYEGAATLTVEDGGLVSNTGVVYIGREEGSSGTVAVQGAGSSWLSASRFEVGGKGAAGLTIKDGGKVSSSSGYIGSDTVGTGTVKVTGAGSLWENTGDFYAGYAGTAALAIEDGGVVKSDTSVIAQTGSGSGTVTVTGADSLWEISGSLEVGYAGTATLSVEDGGTVSSVSTKLAWDGTATGTLNLKGSNNARGVLETGVLTKGNGAATVNWNGGILRATQDTTDFLPGFGAGSINVQSGGAFFDTQNFNVAFGTADVLSGAGGLTKLGGGTLSIAGGNTYGGNTTVSEGTLEFDTYSQSASQTLGIGVRSTTDYGKLKVKGDASFNTKASLRVDVASAATLAKDAVLPDVITAGTLNADGFTVTDNSALFDFETVQNADSVDLKVVVSEVDDDDDDVGGGGNSGGGGGNSGGGGGNSGGGGGNSGGDGGNSGGGNSNSGIYGAVRSSGHSVALGAARVLDAQLHSGVGGDMGNVITALGRLPTRRAVARAVAQTLPLQSAKPALQSTLNSFQSVVQHRTTPVKGASAGDVLSNKQAWIRGFGSRASQDDRGGVAGFDADSWGVASGLEGELSQDTRFGLAYGYARTSLDGNKRISGGAQRADIDSHVIAAYGSKELDQHRQFSYQADLGVNSNESVRHLRFGGLDRTARADYRTHSAHVGVALSQAVELNDKTTLTPALRADYSWMRANRYRERGAGALNLRVGSQKTEALVVGADVHLQHRTGTGSQFDARFGVGYDTIHERESIVATYAGAPGQSFVTRGIDHSPWLIKGGVGYRHVAGNGMELLLRYDAEGRSGYLNHTASVRASWTF